MWEKDLISPQNFVPLLSGHFVRDVSFPLNSKPFLALQMLKMFVEESEGQVLFVTLAVKTQLKSFFVCVIYCFLHKIILHKVKNILWKCNLDIFNTD